MGIEARGSFGLFAECPSCHHSIRHGFQICQECGHIVTGEEQHALQLLWLRNLRKFFILGAISFVALFYFISKL